MVTISSQILMDKFVCLPVELQSEVLLFVGKLSAQYNEQTYRKEKTEIDPELKQLLLSRKEFSETHPSSRIEWNDVRREISKKYGF